MHDADMFVRMPEPDLTAAHRQIEDLLNAFEMECAVAHREETYFVRDNGAVLRRARHQARRRPLDETWTFGRLNWHSGYLQVAGHVVHRIVATAFHGPSPSPDHVVDHIDTNRRNNRAENLRWVTKLDNILLNPITRKRIEIAYGSLGAFFENPGTLSGSDWDWMRAVTREEAQESRARLLAWAEKGQAGRGGTLGEWLYRLPPRDTAPASSMADDQLISEIEAHGETLHKPSFSPPGVQGQMRAPAPLVASMRTGQEPLDVEALTAGAFQRKWRTPTEFPHCPGTASHEALETYLQCLQPGAVFARNRYGDSTVLAAASGPDGAISVVCHTPNQVKNWTRARVFLEGDMYCHESGGMFFTEEGAMKAHCIAIGVPADGYGETIDDYC